MEKHSYPIRVNRYLAQQGLCSRREADVLIEKKIVTINGKIAKLGDKAKEGDKVEIKKQKTPKQNLYFAYHKPVKIVTHISEEGQKSIRDAGVFPKNVYPLGRLDRSSRGLILLTNDGRVTKKLLSPEYDHEKEYIVKVDKKINNFLLKHLRQGVKLENFTTKPSNVKRLGEATFAIILTEGKKHQIRRMCAALGYVVKDLKRVRIMNIKLGEMKQGEQRRIRGEELEIFLKKLGIAAIQF